MSQSLRKSGQFLRESGQSDHRYQEKTSRNPFVNQVNSYGRDKKEIVKEAIQGRNPFVNQVNSYPDSRQKKWLTYS